MKKLIGVRFFDSKRVHYYESNNLVLNKKDRVIVQRDNEIDYGEVVRVMEFHWRRHRLPRVIRIADENDKRRYNNNKRFEKYALDVFKLKQKNYGLSLKIVKVKSAFDGTKIIFYFVSDIRIDFRELVKELARSLKTKIELRQVGVRDEAKMIPSIAMCGRELCCNSHLKQFQSVSIKMAKEQGIALNPVKISGTCGRLMCCLKYEADLYESLNKNLPALNEKVMTPDGKGKIIEINVLLQKARVVLENDSIKNYPLETIKSLADNN